MGDYISNYLLKQGLNAPGVVYSDEEPNENKNEGLISAVSKLQNEIGNRETGIGYDLTPLGNSTKYSKLGIRPGVQLLKAQEAGYLDKILAGEQSGVNKLWHGVTQSLVNEIGLGTLLGFSDIADYVVGGAIRAMKGEDDDYNNPVSTKIQEWQKQFEEYQPIYRDTSLDISNGGLLDAGWWAGNMPSIMSSIALLIPSTATTKGLKYLSKGARTGTKAATKWAARATKLDEAKTAQKLYGKIKDFTNMSSARKAQLGLFGEVSTNALLSRTMENYQEARQVHDDMYEEASNTLDKMSSEEYDAFLKRNEPWLDGVDTNNKDEVAKRIATVSADKTFAEDYANTIFDIIELYGLRNLPFKGFRNERANAKVRKAHKSSIKFANYTPEQKAEELAKRGFWKQTSDKIGGLLYQGKWTLAGQLSEGVEEAVNYIAQQEGMNVGHAMLDAAKGPAFDKRLREYMKAPGLWESAFWGLLGGVVFQSLGSGFNKASNAIEQSIEHSKNKRNSKTGESVEGDDWKKNIWETAEVKRRIRDIEAREGDLQSYRDKLQLIKDGKNPYEFDEQGNNITLNPNQREMFVEKAYNDMLTSMTLRAMDSGNYDLLKEYLASDQVRDAIAESGIVTKEQATQYQQSAIAQMEKIEKQYDDNMIALNNVSKKLNAKRKTPIPVEYLQIIARNNIDHQLQIEDWQRQLDAYEAEVTNTQQQFADKLDPTINYKNAVRLVFLSRQLGELEAEKKELQKDNEFLKSVAGQQTLEEINSNIQTIRDLIYEMEPEQSVPNLLFAIQNALSYVKTDKGYHSDFTQKDYLDIRDKVLDIERSNDAEALKKADEHLASLDPRLAGMTSSDMYRNKVLDDSIRRAYGTIASLDKVSDGLYKDFFKIADLQTGIALERKDINLTEQEVSNEVDRLHNVMNEVRKSAIENAFETVKNLVDKYGADTIRQVLYKKYTNPTTEDNYFGETDEQLADARLFNDVADILNFDSAANRNLFARLEGAIYQYENQKLAQRENNIISENSISESQNLQTDNTSSVEENLNTEQSEQEKQEIQSQESNENEEQPNIQNNEITLAENGEVYAKLTPNDAEDNTFILDVVFDKPKGISLLNDENLYDKNGVSLTEDYVITEKPIVRRGKNDEIIPVKKGLIERATDDNIAKAEEAEAETNAQTSSTGVIQQTIQAAAPAPRNNPLGVTGNSAEDIADNFKPTDFDITSAINRTIQSTVTNAILKGTTVDFKALEKELKDKYLPIVENKKDVNVAIKAAIKSWKGVFDRKNKNKSTETDEVIIKASSITESKTKKGREGLIEEFNKAVDKLVRKYRNDIACDYINGKYYVRIEDLLRYCNNQNKDNSVAMNIYNSILNYLTTSDKYVVIDGTLEDILNKVNQDVDTRFKAITQNNSTYGINFDGYIKSLLDSGLTEDAKKTLEFVDNLNIGDKISYIVSNNAVRFIVNGKTIGYLPKPKIDSKTGARWQYNDGWKTDIINDNGVIKSQLKDLFSKWLTDVNNPDIKAINDFAIIAAFDKLSEKDLKDLAKEFVKNAEIIKAKKQGFIADDIDDITLLKGLGKIWGYTRQISGLSVDKTAKIRLKSLDSWFETQVADSFNMVENLFTTEHGVVELAYISEGELIRTNPEDRLPVSDAIADKYKKSIKLAVAEEIGTLTVAGGGINGETKVKHSGISGGVRKGSTEVIIPTRNGQHGYVHAFPERITSKHIKGEAKILVESIMKEFERIGKDNTSAKQACDELESFMMNLVNHGDSSHSPILRMPFKQNIQTFIEPNTKETIGFSFSYIDINGAEHWIRISYKGTNNATGNTYFRNGLTIYDGKTRVVSDNNVEASKYLAKLLGDNAIFNIGYALVKSDNNTAIELKGLASRDKSTGEFIITIPNQGEFRFSSFNSFILDNDLVSLTTKPGPAGNNYNRQSVTGNQAANQTLKIRPIVNNTTPVEDSNTEPATTKTTAQKVIDILNSSRSKNTIAKQIVKLLYPNKVKISEISDIVFDLFPKNIKFVDKYIGANCLSNVSSEDTIILTNLDVIIEPQQVIIGKEWMDLLNGTRKDKKQAARKLVHEQLHIVLNRKENKKYKEQIRAIFNEFAARNTNKALNVYLFKDNKDFYTYGVINTEGLEEFLVESLTSEELATALNNIESTSETNEGTVKESLLQKIMRALSNIFGWKIKEGSLYEKEFKLLRDIIEEENSDEGDNNQSSESYKVVNKVYSKTAVDDAVSDLLTEGYSKEDIIVDHIPETEDTDDYYLIKVKKTSKEEQINTDESVTPTEFKPENTRRSRSHSILGKYSTITENPGAASVTSMVNSLPITSQPNIIRKINNGIINTYCK